MVVWLYVCNLEVGFMKLTGWSWCVAVVGCLCLIGVCEVCCSCGGVGLAYLVLGWVVL